MISKMTLSAGQRLTYRCPPAITWLRDTDQILVVDAERGRFWVLRGVEAAIWDCLALPYPYEKIVHFLSLLLRVTGIEAAQKLLDTLQSWQVAGLIRVVGEEDHGESGH